MDPHLSPAVLIKVSNTTRTAGSVSGGLTPTEASYRARGMSKEWSGERIPGSNSRREARKVALLGKTIAGGKVPAIGDKVTIEGVTYTITEIDKRDPDGAMWTFSVTK